MKHETSFFFSWKKSLFGNRGLVWEKETR